jgi:hypothetical protein
MAVPRSSVTPISKAPTARCIPMSAGTGRILRGCSSNFLFPGAFPATSRRRHRNRFTKEASFRPYCLWESSDHLQQSRAAAPVVIVAEQMGHDFLRRRCRRRRRARSDRHCHAVAAGRFGRRVARRCSGLCARARCPQSAGLSTLAHV